MVTAGKILTCSLFSSFLVGCGTPETNARLGGVSPQDAAEIAPLVRAWTSARILSYSWMSEGAVCVRTTETAQLYMAERVHGKWKVSLVPIDPFEIVRPN
jgi:hypothetical protein